MFVIYTWKYIALKLVLTEIVLTNEIRKKKTHINQNLMNITLINIDSKTWHEIYRTEYKRINLSIAKVYEGTWNS